MMRPMEHCRTGADVVSRLDEMARPLRRRLRVYVIGHKERPKAEIERLIRKSDVCVDAAAWELVDDRARYDWINR